jgi:hypothetical protein
LGLTAGMRDAADEVPASPPLSQTSAFFSRSVQFLSRLLSQMMSTIDSSLYKTKFEHYTTADGEQVVRKQRVELSG